MCINPVHTVSKHALNLCNLHCLIFHRSIRRKLICPYICSVRNQCHIHRHIGIILGKRCNRVHIFLNLLFIQLVNIRQKILVLSSVHTVHVPSSKNCIQFRLGIFHRLFEKCPSCSCHIHKTQDHDHGCEYKYCTSASLQTFFILFFFIFLSKYQNLLPDKIRKWCTCKKCHYKNEHISKEKISSHDTNHIASAKSKHHFQITKWRCRCLTEEKYPAKRCEKPCIKLSKHRW